MRHTMWLIPYESYGIPRYDILNSLKILVRRKGKKVREQIKTEQAVGDDRRSFANESEISRKEDHHWPGISFISPFFIAISSEIWRPRFLHQEKHPKVRAISNHDYDTYLAEVALKIFETQGIQYNKMDHFKNLKYNSGKLKEVLWCFIVE